MSSSVVDLFVFVFGFFSWKFSLTKVTRLHAYLIKKYKKNENPSTFDRYIVKNLTLRFFGTPSIYTIYREYIYPKIIIIFDIFYLTIYHIYHNLFGPPGRKKNVYLYINYILSLIFLFFKVSPKSLLKKFMISENYFN